MEPFEHKKATAIVKANADALELLRRPEFCMETEQRLTDSLFCEFACERIAAFYARQNGQPYTSKFQTISKHRYTNPYRILDRVTQALIKTIVLGTVSKPITKAFCCYVFRVPNEPATYDKLVRALGVKWEPELCFDQAYVSDLIPNITRIVTNMQANGEPVFRPAYKRCTAIPYVSYFNNLSEFATEKFQTAFANAKTLSDYFMLLMPFIGFGPFLSYQLALDWNYCLEEPFAVDFVVPGPGARRGCSMVFGAESMPVQIARIKYVTRHYQRIFPYWVDFMFEGNKLALQENDVQNLFCEFSKFFGAHVLGDTPKRKLDTLPAPLDIQIPYAYANSNWA